MSCYIVDNEVIDVIVTGFVRYKSGWCGSALVDYHSESTKNFIGQMLLEQNYASVNARYGENTPTPTYIYKAPKEYDEGFLFGSIQNYEYQSCETDDWLSCDTCISLHWLKDRMLEDLIEEKGLGRRVPSHGDEIKENIDCVFDILED